MRQGFLFLLISVALATAGCGGKGGAGRAQDPQEAALNEVAELLRAAAQTIGKAPSKVSDLDRVRSPYPNGYEAVKSGNVIVLWSGTAIKGEGEMANGGGSVVAYTKDTPSNGGFVLLDSGEVKKVSASEFDSLPKVSKK